MKRAYLTVFLSLTISIMLSLILALLESARIGAVKMKAECATDISTYSVLAEYNRALYEKYDLLMVDCSYQSETPSMANVEEHLKYFMQGNFDTPTFSRITGARTMLGARCKEASIPGYSFATDGDFAVLRRQILAYMAGEPISRAMISAGNNLDDLSSRGYDTRDVEAEAQENRERLNSIELNEPEHEENDGEKEGENQEDGDGEDEEAVPDNPADAVESSKGIGVVSLSIKDPSSVSTSTVRLDSFASHRNNNRGTGLDESEPKGVANDLLLDQYIVEKSGCYTKHGDDSPLKYQLEYIIGGKNNDYDNLEHCGRIIIFWREASNLAYLANDSAKVSEVETLAATISALLFTPELEEPLKWSMLFAWSFAESINDMHILYEGGKVPLVKDSESWHISFSELPFFREHLGGDNASGLTYKDHLRMLLLLVGKKDKTKRLADMIEMDVRTSPGNAAFRLDWCLDVFESNLSIESDVGLSMKMVRRCGYEN